MSGLGSRTTAGVIQNPYDVTGFLIEELAAPGSIREDVASWYALGLRTSADWPRVNAAILERYSASGLAYIKRKAWAENRRRGL